MNIIGRLKAENIHPTKSLGQNFLYDSKIVDKIVDNEDIEGRVIIEIGPGPGMLTKAIIDRQPAKLIIVEKDLRLVKFLKDDLEHYGNKVEIIEADALKVDIGSLSDQKVSIISNLPYNISVKLLSNWFNETHRIEKMILMFQKEVGERLMARKSTKAYGSLSVITQWLFELENKFHLSPGSFYPAPKVSSSVIRFKTRTEPLYQANKINLEKLCKHLFQMRRKMISNSLKSLLENGEEILKKLDIDASLRPEDLSIEQLCKISSYV